MPMPSLFDDPEITEDSEPYDDDLEGDDFPEETGDGNEPRRRPRRQPTRSGDPGIDDDDDDNETADSADEDEAEPADPDQDEDTDEETGVPAAAEVAGLRSERLVPFSELLLEYKHWQNPRRHTGLDKESLEALADDIAAKSTQTQVRLDDGTVEPRVIAGNTDALLVVQIRGANGATDLLVLDGQRRHKAIEIAWGIKKGAPSDVLVKVVDREPEPVEWSQELAQRYLLEVLGSVGQRQGLSNYELAESARSLQGTIDPDTGKEFTIAEIARRIGRSPSWTSKIFSAMANASAKVLAKWRTGEITEEVFRELVAGVQDKTKQEEEADKIAAARESGDKAAARQTAKEAAELARQQKREAKEKAKREAEEKKAAAKAAKEAEKAAKKAKKVVRGPQAQLPLAKEPSADSKPEKAAAKPDGDKPAKPKPVPFAIIEDYADQAKKKPPTHELVKGIIMGLQVAAGLLAMEDLPKPWHAYVHRLAGTVPEKSGKGKGKGKRAPR